MDILGAGTGGAAFFGPHLPWRGAVRGGGVHREDEGPHGDNPPWEMVKG